MSSDIGNMLRRVAGHAFNMTAKKLAGPWLINDLPEKPGQRGDAYAVATDGKVIVWVADPLVSKTWIYPLTNREDDEDDEDDKAIKQALLPHFAPDSELSPAWEGALSDLRQHCGNAIWTVPCSECDGRSKNSAYVSCTFCDDDGDMIPDAKPGYVCGVPLDLGCLARVLEPFDSFAPIQIVPETLRESGDRRLWIINWHFRLALMGMRVATNPDHDLFKAWKNAPRLCEGATV